MANHKNTKKNHKSTAPVSKVEELVITFIALVVLTATVMGAAAAFQFGGMFAMGAFILGALSLGALLTSIWDIIFRMATHKQRSAAE